MLEIDPTEKIIKVVHRHWFILLGNIFFLIVCVALPVITLFTMHFLPIEEILRFTGQTSYAGAFFLFSWLLFVWMLAWKMWTTYYFDVILITDKRIFNIEQIGFFDRESGSFRIDRIQNVTVDQKGLIQTLLDFGSIRFETAGGDDQGFIARYIADPYELKRLINDMQDGRLDRTQEVHLHSDSIESLAYMKTNRTNSDGQYRGGKLNDAEGI